MTTFRNKLFNMICDPNNDDSLIGLGDLTDRIMKLIDRYYIMKIEADPRIAVKLSKKEFKLLQAELKKEIDKKQK